MHPDLLRELEYELEAEFEALGESEWEDEFEAPEDPGWPTGRLFKPDNTLAPIGRYQTSSTMPCEQLTLDSRDLFRAFNTLNDTLAQMDQMQNATTRDPDAWDKLAFALPRHRSRVEQAMKDMIQRVRDGTYTADGCKKGPRGKFQKLAEQLLDLKLQGGWNRRSPYKVDRSGNYVANLRRLRDVLGYWLTH
jgi:hypothetical protein